MNSQQPLTINMSSIKVAGVGGLGMVATVVVMALAIPAARALLIAGIITGTLLAWWMIRSRRDHPLDGRDGAGPLGLGLAATGSPARSARADTPDDPMGPRLTTTWPQTAVYGALGPC